MTLFDNEHLTNRALQALLDAQLDNDQSIAVAEHIAGCEVCAKKLADCVAQQPAAPPRGFIESAMRRIYAEEREQQKRFYRFCTQIAVCAAVVLGVAFSGILSSWDHSIKSAPLKSETASSATVSYATDAAQALFQRVGSFVNNLIPNEQLEENNNDSAKK